MEEAEGAIGVEKLIMGVVVSIVNVLPLALWILKQILGN